jgi:outer membrane lipoprotein-sorting protein
MLARVASATLLLVCLLLELNPARAEQGGDAVLDALLARLAKIESLIAHFSEEKQMALLAVPLRSQGTLYYAKPRLLARHTQSPQKSSLVLRGDKLEFGDAAHSESMGLDAQPAVRVLVDTFVSVLSGDRAQLSKLAQLEVESLPAEGWRIHVTPRDPAVLRIVRKMSFEGKGPELSRMELLDANGDRTLTNFSEVQLGKRLSDAEVARLFRIGG